MAQSPENKSWLFDESVELPMFRAPRVSNPGLEGSLPFVTDADLIDLSVGGAGLETRHSLPLHHDYRLKIGGESGLDLLGALRWTQLQSTQTERSHNGAFVYRFGLQFGESLHQGRQIQEYLNLHSGEPNGERKPPRFFLNDPELAAQVRLNCPFVVRSISASGALLEIDLAPETGTLLDLHLALPNGPISVKAEVVDSILTNRDEELQPLLALKFQSDESNHNRLKTYLDNQLKSRI